jgi:NitT/TauT family transport system ATP-binding protein
VTADRAGGGRVVDTGPVGASVRIAGVSKTFADGTRALEDISLSVGPGEFVACVGPSGCGKSTLLRVVAGLTAPSAGECTIADGTRRAFVFQEPTLLPWRTTLRNAELLLMLEGVDREARRASAQRALRLVGLEGFEHAYPRALSGGMRMRLSLARALALRPQLFLFDEPFASVDEITREALNEELSRIWADQGFTALLVTHHLHEAVFLAQRVVVLSPRPGRVADVVEVPFDGPRTFALRTDPAYLRIVARLAERLREVT